MSTHPLPPFLLAFVDQAHAELDTLVGRVRAHLPDCGSSEHKCPGPEVFTDLLLSSKSRHLTLLVLALVELAKLPPAAGDLPPLDGS